MQLIGKRIRNFRRSLLMNQKDIAGKRCTSFISRIENGVSIPSLKNLKEWSGLLRTTSSELIGDQVLLDIAKGTILQPEKCQEYLQHLPENETTTFIKNLSASVRSVSTPVPEPPQDAELQYLTAQVHLKKGFPHKALDLTNQALQGGKHPITHIRLLYLSYRIYEILGESHKMQEASESLHSYLKEYSYNKIIQNLPDPETVTSYDVDLFKLSLIIKELDLN